MKQAVARQLIAERMQQGIALQQSLLKDKRYLNAVSEVGFIMARALRSGRKVLFFGNGGSAADAQHLAAELNGRFMKERAPLPGLALTCNSSALTAIANDYSFEEVFARQLQGLATRGDVAFGISTSGNSQNILSGMKVAKAMGLTRVGLSGGAGGALSLKVDHCITIPSKSTPRIQEAQILTGHILCEIVENELFGE